MAPTTTPDQPLPLQMPPAGRTLWNSDMITCLLELRLGLLLSQFAGAGGAPGALKDAWKTLQLKFAIATNVNLSMLQLKNKYQQLKREYQLTTQQLEARRTREAKRNKAPATGAGAGADDDTEDDGDDDEVAFYELDDNEEIALPQYWSLVQKAFDDVGGNDLHKAYATTTATTTKAKQRPIAAVNSSKDDGDTPPTSTDSHTTTIKSQPTSRRNSVEPVQPSQSRSISEHPAPRDAQAAATVSPGYVNPYVHRREPNPTFQREAPRYFPRPFTPQPSPAYNTSPSSTNNAQQKRPLNTAQDPHSSTNSGPAAKVQKMDLAQALVSVGNTIASAMVESAKIIAGAGVGAETSASGTAAAESITIAHLAAKMDVQLANQARMLALLEKSFATNEALIEQQHKQNNNTSSPPE